MQTTKKLLFFIKDKISEFVEKLEGWGYRVVIIILTLSVFV